MENQIEIYTTRDNETAVEVRFEKETVWLNRNQLIISILNRNLPG